MAEKTLNDPLSGFEIKQILLDEIEKRLNGDCTLGNDLAYAGFQAKFDIKITFLRSLTPATVIWGGAQKKAPEGVETTPEAAILADTYTSPAPNVARTEHSLPIPVMIQTPTGPVRQRVHIEGKRGPGRPPKVPQL